MAELVYAKVKLAKRVIEIITGFTVMQVRILPLSQINDNKMGEIANDMIDGFCCSCCGIYFTEEHGFPVYCEECWEDGDDLPIAINDEL